MNESLIIEEYTSGNSIKVLSRRYNISEYIITKILKRNNIKIENRSPTKMALDDHLLQRLYDDGKSTLEIAQQFNCSDETIRKRIKTRSTAEVNKLRTDETFDKISESCKLKWKDEQYIDKVKFGTNTEKYLEALRKHGIDNYDATLGRWIKSEDGRSSISDIVKKRWSNTEYYESQKPHFVSRAATASNAAIIALQDPIKRASWIAKIQKSNSKRIETRGWISSSQRQFYYLLESSGINYIPEGPNTRVGPFYVVDCIIPKQQSMVKDLVVEIQGEYWHSLPKTIIRDQQKKTYIQRHTDYDLLQFKELNLSSFEDTKNILLQYGIDIPSLSFSVHDITIKQITEHDAKDFFSIFHYTSTVRKGAITFGAYYSGFLIAAISYTYPIRNQIAQHYNCKQNEIMEISRLARMTNIECNNLLSYFIGKTKKLLPKPVQILISYADSTYGHTGGVYKACGFTHDGDVPPDYHYASQHGIYHKKTIWDKSKRLKMQEDEYAAIHGLHKIYGNSKTKWIYKLR